VLPLVACDQAAKQFARHTLAHQSPIDLLGGVVRFEFALNPGGFLSLGAAWPESLRFALFGLLVPAFVTVLAWRLWRSPQTAQLARWGLVFVVAGGLGNWVDRFANSGAVVDFVSLGAFGLRTGIFNVADVVLIIGAGLIALSVKTTPPEPTLDPAPGEPPVAGQGAT
jgi:signal peptidase II